MVNSSANYWIAAKALTISLNALGDANRIQCGLATGSVIMCYIRGVQGLEYDEGHNYRRWPLTITPTFFDSDVEKYVYVAIPRTAAVGNVAQVCFPSQKIDIYGYVVDAQGQSTDERIGNDNFYYIWLQCIISEVRTIDGVQKREFVTAYESGTLSTDEAADPTKSDWYRYDVVTEIVQLLKQIEMAEGSSFLNLILGSGNRQGELEGVAKTNVTPIESTKDVVTPAFMNDFMSGRFLSKTNDDEAAGIITFLKGLVFKGLLKSFGAREGFMDGVGIIMNALEGLIETDGLNVRGFMRVMELIINRLQLMESDYSFTEGDTVEHIAYEDEGQTLVLTMHKDHDNDYTPFYPGDIIYGIVNDLLPHDSQLPDGHIKTSNGSHYHTWMRVKSVDLTQNKLRVAIYQGKRISGYDEHDAPIYEPIVPGGTNFSPYGTAITTDVATPMQQEMQQIGAEGYDTMLEITRHGNVADGIDPETGQYSPSIYQSQKGRQQAWVLSTTDKRLSFFWNVDTPIVHDENYALCLGILPDLANLPATRNKEMPSLYINTIFYDHQHRANYPAKVEKVDRGEWRQTPYETYTDPYSGTYTPDGTLDATDPDLADYVALVPIINGWAGTYASGQEVQEPYHYRSFTKCQWLRYRLDTLGYGSLTDKTLLLKMMKEWTEEVSLQTSRVWNNGKLWECTVDYTSQEPRLGCTDWLVVSGNMLWTMGFASTNGNAFYQGHVQTTVTAHLYWGDEDVTAIVGAAAFDWTRSSESGKTAADEAWDADTTHQGTNRLALTDNDMPTAWSRNNKAIFTCTATTTYGGEQVIVQNQIIA